MAWAPDYITLAQLKAHLRITDTDDDTLLAFAITAASRAIDHTANRQFGLVDPAVARYYTYGSGWQGRQDPLSRDYAGGAFRGQDVLEIDDLMTTTSLVVKVDRNDDGTFEETLTVDTHYRLYPWNAAASGRPWTHLVLNTGTTFPTSLRGVEVTAKWGWTTPPSIVVQAALIQAGRFFSRRNAPFGVAGSPDAGSEMRLLARLDPDVDMMVSSVKRHWAWA